MVLVCCDSDRTHGNITPGSKSLTWDKFTCDHKYWGYENCASAVILWSLWVSPVQVTTPMQAWSSMWTSVLPSFMPMLEVGLPPDLRLNYLCAHVSDWMSFPNCGVKCPSLQNLLFQPSLLWLELQSSRVQGEICCVSFILAFAWSENQVGGSSLFCWSPMQVYIVQMGGFICWYILQDLSLLGAFFRKIKIKRLWSINGLSFKYQSLLWVR